MSHHRALWIGMAITSVAITSVVGFLFWQLRQDERSSTSVALYDGAVSISILDPLDVCDDTALEGRMIYICDSRIPLREQRLGNSGTVVLVTLFDVDVAHSFGYANEVEGSFEDVGAELEKAYFRQSCSEAIGCYPGRRLTAEARTLGGQPAWYLRANFVRGGAQELAAVGLEDGRLLIVTYNPTNSESDNQRFGKHFAHIVDSIRLDPQGSPQ